MKRPVPSLTNAARLRAEWTARARGVVGRRAGPTRKLTLAPNRLTAEEIRQGQLLETPADIQRPRTRGECADGERPCPWVSCKFHMYLDVNPSSGSVTLNYPDLEPWELQESCVLDVADRAGTTLEAVGELMSLTRERIRQIEENGLRKLREEADDGA